jgi:hypothetical protein
MIYVGLKFSRVKGLMSLDMSVVSTGSYIDVAAHSDASGLCDTWDEHV